MTSERIGIDTTIDRIGMYGEKSKIYKERRETGQDGKQPDAGDARTCTPTMLVQDQVTVDDSKQRPGGRLKGEKRMRDLQVIHARHEIKDIAKELAIIRGPLSATQHRTSRMNWTKLLKRNTKNQHRIVCICSNGNPASKLLDRSHPPYILIGESGGPSSGS